jgi:hypothetical protein
MDPLSLTLGNRIYTVQELDLNQQRAIGTALFSVKTPTNLADPTPFDFPGEFDSAVAIVRAAIRDAESADKDKWLAETKATWRQLQRAKAAVLEFAGYTVRKDPSGVAASGEALPVAE